MGDGFYASQCSLLRIVLAVYPGVLTVHPGVLTVHPGALTVYPCNRASSTSC